MSVRPTAFVFSLEPTFTPSTVVELGGGNLIVVSYLPEGGLVPGSKHQVTPTAPQWTAFWNAVAFLDVWSWKPDYSSSDVGACVDDGKGWRLKIEHLEKSIRTKGTNAYPSFGSPDVTSLDEERFGLFLFALGELLSHKWGLTSRST